jgi:hypothetical protein
MLILTCANDAVQAKSREPPTNSARNFEFISSTLGSWRSDTRRRIFKLSKLRS